MASMYKKYVEEREPNTFVLEHEFGFATYSMTEVFYLQDVYVDLARRKTGCGKELLAEICAIAGAAGYHEIITSACFRANNLDISFKAILACGFKPVSSNSELIFFKLDIRNFYGGLVNG